MFKPIYLILTLLSPFTIVTLFYFVRELFITYFRLNSTIYFFFFLFLRSSLVKLKYSFYLSGIRIELSLFETQ